MDTNTGTILKFQNEEEKKRHEEMLKKFAESTGKEPPLFLQLGNFPKEGCRFCGSEGAVQSKRTLKWIPCVCTNPVY